MDTASYKVIYNEARGAVTRQVSEVEEVRAAAGRALGVGALAATVVSGIKSIESDLGWVAVVIAAFLLVAFALTGYIWWPRWGWRFEIGATDAIEQMLEKHDDDDARESLTEAEVYRERALHLEEDFDSNEALLGKLRRAFQCLLVALGLLIVALVLTTI